MPGSWSRRNGHANDVLNNGVEIPALGLVVFQTPDETRGAALSAIGAGYR